jgi:hypothetical protein
LTRSSLCRCLAPLPALCALAAALTLIFPAFSVSGSSVRFVDIAAKSGINAQLVCGSAEKNWIPEANGTGAAWLDYDNDGLPDLLIVNGSSMERLRAIVSDANPGPQEGGVFLYRNLGGGRFRDVTREAGLSNPYWGTGANAADYDNDGHTDILITTIGRDLLYHNNGNGTFNEVGAAAGLSRKVAWHTGSAFGDYDGDGRLDLFVAGYVDIHELLKRPEPGVCNYRGVPGFCGPRGLKGERDILYHNNGDGTFTEVTERAGVADTGLYHGFTAVFDDFNGDGKIDLFVANDSDPNYLYLNQGNGTFKEAALPSGLALNGNGDTQSNMGVAIGDYDGDGLIDVLTTTFSQDYFPLFRQLRPGQFEDVAAAEGLTAITGTWVGWSCGFTDFDNDGVKELWVANGHVYPEAGRLGGTSYFEPLAILERRQNKFRMVDGAVSQLTANSYRGGCSGDFNNDGKVDLAVLPISGRPLLLENRTQSAGNWVGFALRGHRSNRDGIGSRVEIEYCGHTQVDTVRNGGSYISHNDSRVHFGLGACRSVPRVTVRWASGIRQVLRDVPLNRYTLIDERAN